VKGLSATDAALRNLPLMLGTVTTAFVAGLFVTLFGYYTPFMILASIVTPIGGALLATINSSTSSAKLFGYQFLTGNGLGFGMQQPLMAVQAVLPLEEIPIGTAAIVFFQSLGGAVFIAVSQTIFQEDLIKQLSAALPMFQPSMVSGIGATNLKDLVPKEYLIPVTNAFNHALTRTYYIPMALGAISILGALATEWRSVKGKQIDAVHA
jgi:hypothetical protein